MTDFRGLCPQIQLSSPYESHLRTRSRLLRSAAGSRPTPEICRGFFSVSGIAPCTQKPKHMFVQRFLKLLAAMFYVAVASLPIVLCYVVLHVFTVLFCFCFVSLCFVS